MKMRSASLFSLVVMISACNAQPSKLQTNKDDNTLLWEVSGKGLSAPSYLYGTFHLMCSSDIHFSDPFKKAVKDIDEVYMELDMDDPSVLLSGMLLMNMNDGKHLKDLYKPEEYKRLKTFFTDSLNTPFALFESMKPAFLESMLYPKMMPCKSITGVEEELMKLAKEDKKEIQGLETMAFQASVFDSIPYEEQAKDLLKTIDSLAEYKKYFDTMINVYKSQHLKEIGELFSKSESGMDEHKDLLLNNRNANWVKQLKDIMKKERVFVAVGAGHLVGEQGLIALLRKEGYTVRPLENK